MVTAQDSLYIVQTDGGSRGNPGPAAWAFVIDEQAPLTETIVRGGFIPHATNNVAEYQALIEALKFAQVEGIKRLAVFSDSKLMVEQMTGRWAVKHEDMKPLWVEATLLSRSLNYFSIQHIRREFNDEADAECNRVLDIHSGSRKR
jgi:ribonuclease HI